MALVWGRTIVTLAGTPGPLLGDGVNTIATVIAPASIGNELTIADSMGGHAPVLNQAVPPQFAVCKLSLFPRKGNTAAVFIAGAGSLQADKISQPPPATTVNPFMVLGDGDRRTTMVSDIEVDAAVSGEGWVWVLETD